MAKFKVGDIVKCVCGSCSWEQGRIVTVIAKDDAISEDICYDLISLDGLDKTTVLEIFTVLVRRKGPINILIRKDHGGKT